MLKNVWKKNSQQTEELKNICLLSQTTPLKYMNLQNSFVANQTELNQIDDAIIRSKIEQIEIKQGIFNERFDQLEKMIEKLIELYHFLTDPMKNDNLGKSENENKITTIEIPSNDQSKNLNIPSLSQENKNEQCFERQSKSENIKTNNKKEKDKLNVSNEENCKNKQFHHIVDEIYKNKIDIHELHLNMNNLSNSLEDQEFRLDTTSRSVRSVINKQDQNEKKTDSLVQRFVESLSNIVDLQTEMKNRNFFSFVEKNTIEKWNDMVLGNKLFDSIVDEMKCRNISFNNAIIGKENILLGIEDYNGNKFGCFIHGKIASTVTYTWMPVEKGSFVFSLKSNGRIDGVKKYDFKNTKKGYYLFPDYRSELIAFGNGVLEIYKNEESEKSKFMFQKVNDEFDGIENSLVGRAYENQINFVPKRIVAYQMEETFESLERKRIELKECYEKESQQLNEINLNEILVQKIKIIEETTGRNCKNVLFDSNICQWDRYYSSFDKRLFGKKQLTFIIETEDNNFICFYIHSQLNQYKYEGVGGKCHGNDIFDSNAFIFTFKNGDGINNVQKYPIDYEKHINAFSLFDKDDKRLFGIGINDILVMKKRYQNENESIPQTYRYENNENPFNFNTNSNHKFVAKRIIVLQMNEDEQNQINEMNGKEYVNEINESVDVQKTNFTIDQEKQILQKHKSKIQNEFSSEIKQIEQWTKTIFDEVAFSSDYCNWKKYFSTFLSHLLGRERIVILVEDNKKNQYGVFIETRIPREINSQMKSENYLTIFDKNMFLFSMKTNGKLIQPIKSNVKPERFISKINFSHENRSELFSIGEGLNFCVGKETNQNISYLSRDLFCAGKGIKKLTEKYGKKENINIKRIHVFQMKETVDQEKERKKRERDIMMIKENKFNEETKLLKESLKITTLIYEKQIKQIEKWSNLTFANEVVFDSNYCYWSEYFSTFNRRIMNREKLSFIIETYNNEIFGGFVFKRIDVYRRFDEKQRKTKGICDNDSFTFTFKDQDNPMNFYVKSEYKTNNEPHFLIYDDNDWRLFVFGNCDIYILKKGRPAACCKLSESIYNYHNEENALVGKSGWDNEKERFEIKRIIVLQFK